MYTSVLFDLDGTLLDTLEDIAAAGNHTLSALSFPTHPVSAYRRMVGNGVPKLLERSLPAQHRGQGTHSIALSLYNTYYLAHMDDLTKPYPGIVGLLQNLKDAGVTLSVLSNKSDAFVQQMVEAYFPATFDMVLGHCEEYPAKPDPTSALAVLENIGADPTTTLYVGDSDVDMFTAANAGLDSCAVLWGFRDEEELRNAGAQYCVASAEELQAVILGG